MGHKEECIALQEVAPRVPTPSILLVWRLLFKRVKEQKTSSDALGHEFATYLNARMVFTNLGILALILCTHV